MPRGCPSKIRICDQTWKVTYFKNLIEEKQLYGATIPDERLIIIDASKSLDVIQSTLTHEILHACASMSNHDVGNEAQEGMVRALENTLFSALRSNAPWWK